MVTTRWGSEGAATNHPLVDSRYLVLLCFVSLMTCLKSLQGILILWAVPDPETVTGLKPYLSWATPGEGQLQSDKCYSNHEETLLCCKESFTVLTFRLLFKICGVCLLGNSCSRLLRVLCEWSFCWNNLFASSRAVIIY